MDPTTNMSSRTDTDVFRKKKKKKKKKISKRREE
jgi:hypothetical protein